MNQKRLYSVLTGVVATIFLFAGISLAAPLDKIQFIKIAAMDEMAVIKDADGKLRVIKTGDTICENVSVASISAGRIVLHEKTDKGTDTLIVRVENGAQRIERITNRTEVRPVAGAAQKSPKP